MKTLVKTFIASAFSAVVLVSLTFNASANEIPTTNANVKNVINTFVDSYKNNNYKALKNILADNATYKYSRESAVIAHSGQDLLKFVKQNEGLSFQDFSSKSQIVSQSDAMVMAKITLNQGKSNQSEQYVTLENNGKGAWKITQIYQVYEQTATKGQLAK